MSLKDDILWATGRGKIMTEALVDTHIKVHKGADLAEIKADLKERLIEEIDAESTYSKLVVKVKESALEEDQKNRIIRIVKEVRKDEAMHVELYTRLLDTLDERYKKEKKAANKEWDEMEGIGDDER